MYNIKDIPAPYRNRAKGSLIVKITKPTQLGCSDAIIPTDSIGFVQASKTGQYLCDFPFIKKTGVVVSANTLVMGRQPK